MDEVKRRWLVTTDMDLEEQAHLWISALIPRPLPSGDLQPLLRSGEVSAIFSGPV